MVDKKRKSKKGKSKKGLKQKQKQKQQVTVNVSSGGGGGFIPAPVSQAPTFDYSLLANLIRPAATVDVPIMAQQMAPALPARAAEAPSLVASIATQTPVKPPSSLSAKEKAMIREPPEEEAFRLSKFTPEMRERIAESGAPIVLEKPASIRKPVKRVPVEDVSPESIKSGGAVIGGGIFNRPAREKSLRETIPTEPLYEGSSSVRL